MKRKLLTSVGALIMLGMTTHAGMAGTQTANMHATITIVEGCTVNANDINFGTWANLKSERYQTSQVMVSCNVNGSEGEGAKYKTDYKVSLSAGKSNDVQNRKMMDPSNNAIVYNIYLNENYTSIFGDGTSGTSVLNGKVKDTTDDVYTIYAKTVKTATNPAAGVYTDILTLTVDY